MILRYPQFLRGSNLEMVNCLLFYILTSLPHGKLHGVGANLSHKTSLHTSAKLNSHQERVLRHALLTHRSRTRQCLQIFNVNHRILLAVSCQFQYPKGCCSLEVIKSKICPLRQREIEVKIVVLKLGWMCPFFLELTVNGLWYLPGNGKLRRDIIALPKKP